ncbi:MAG: UDP-N-acetylglucosamine 1-carboxyvinyltransferase, partial [Clostridia bacterium]
AAKEPEIVDLANCLNQMGASITGAGTGTVTILGVERLHGAIYRPIPDRVEAGTLLCAAAITQGSVLVRGACAEHMRSLTFKLTEAGVSIRETPAGMRLNGVAATPFEVRTLAYPGFPTDMQALITIVALRCHGTSMLHETVFENRFMHAAELCRLGAEIRVENNMALIEGGKPLQGGIVRSTDLRAGAALMLAGLLAQGETLLQDPAGHIERGYQDLPEKLRQLGADIESIDDFAG